MYYVTMTDRFMSGWGLSDNRTNKLVIECDNLKDAYKIKDNAEKRPEMRYINIVSVKPPYYSPKKYYVNFKKFSDMGGKWIE